MNIPLSAFPTPESLEQQFMEIPLPSQKNVGSLFPQTKKAPEVREKKLDRTVSRHFLNLPIQETYDALPKINAILDGISRCINLTNCLRDSPSLEKLKTLAYKIKETVSSVFGKPADDKQKAALNTTKQKIVQTIKHLKLCSKEGRKLLQKHPGYFQRCPNILTSDSHPLSESFRTFVRDNRVAHIGKINLPSVLEGYYNQIFIRSMKLKAEKSKEEPNTLELLQNTLDNTSINDFTKMAEFETLNEELAALWNRLLMSGNEIDAYLPTFYPTQKRPKEEVSVEIWKNRSDLFQALLSNVPDLKVNAAFKTKLQYHTSLYNNYGLPLDSSPKLGEDKVLSIQAGNTTYRIPADKGTIRTASQLRLHYKPETRQLFSSIGPMTMCDAIALPSPESKNPLVATICDGCGWGETSKQAAETAAATTLRYTNKRLKNRLTLRQIAEIQLEALSKAHKAIIGENKDVSSCGLTTILHLSIVDGYLIAISLGDCRLFIIRSPSDTRCKECTDLTARSRDGSIDASDPGGKLGPGLTLEGELVPELNNLSVHVAYLNPGDIVIVASDGLGDLLDPTLLNEPPTLFGLPEHKWDKTLPAHKEKLKMAAENKMLQLIDGKNTVEEISEAIDAYAAGMVKKYLVNLICTPPKSKFGMSKEEFPGKPDHKAHIVIKLDPPEYDF